MKKAATVLRAILIAGLFMSVLSLPLCASIAADFMAPERSYSAHAPEDCP